MKLENSYLKTKIALQKLLKIIYRKLFMKTMSTPLKLTGTGLEDVRIPGQTFLRDALTSCTDPLKAIETFQVRFLDLIYLNAFHSCKINFFCCFMSG